MKNPVVAVFGTGLMGAPCVLRLLDAGYPVVIWNRTHDKTEELARRGAKVAESPAQAVASADILITWLADRVAIQEVLFPAERASLLEGKTIIQMGTIGPDHSRAFEDAAQAHGADYLEAPVLGSIPQVKSGTLQIMVGGSEKQFNAQLPLLKNFGPNPVLIGPVGQAAALKLAFNQLIVGLTSSFCLSLGLIEREGVRVEQFMDMLRESTLNAPTFDKKLLNFLNRDYDHPNFPTRHLLKDAELFLDVASDHGLATNGLEGMRDIINFASIKGLADADYSAIYEVINPPKD